ncbi:MAG TPA: hypothetical protein VGD60_05345 [Candidatus Acidoferrales bacterium]
MSWGFAYQGKPSRVKAEVEKVAQTFSIPEEQKSFDNAKASIIATLEGRDDSRPVFVVANGSATFSTTSKSCEVFTAVKDFPIATIWPNVGQWVSDEITP